MKRKHMILVLALAAMLALTVTACGSGGSAEGEPTVGEVQSGVGPVE